MKKILYCLLASVCISLQSCLYQEESYFDDSSANRATTDVERCGEILKNAPNGWKLEYYAGKNYSMGGITLLCKFDGENVTIMSEIGSTAIKPGVKTTSLYKVVSEQSTLLTFDTFNELLHCFSKPILNQNNNFQGDYEFVITSASENEIILQGKKYQNEMVMTPMPVDTDWNNYIQHLNQIANEAFLNNYILKAGGEKVGEVERYSHAFNISTQTESQDAPFIYTAEGIRFRHPITIGGKALQNFKWNKTRMTFTCTDTGAEHISMEGVYPTEYKRYEDYIGFYYFYYKTLNVNDDGTFSFVDAMPFIVQLKQKTDQENYILTGSELDADIIVTYEKSIGKLVILPQQTGYIGQFYGTYILGNNETYALPAHMGADFGYIASYVDTVHGLVAETSAEGILSFVEYNTFFKSIVGSPATSLVLTGYSSEKISGGTYLGYLSWMDSIQLMPY